ncbi:MAG: TetR/AcrR family transcriptional regulator [Paraperlucidibaca sp.]
MSEERPIYAVKATAPAPAEFDATVVESDAHAKANTRDTLAATADSRASQRRQQVLEAAEHCFRACGFHSASIASIAKKAGMSSGHIYHYFENKEAIIGASVAHDAEVTVERMEGFARSDDVLATLVEQAEGALMRSLDASRNALVMEILAEAGRNARVAEQVQAADVQVAQVLQGLVRRAWQAKHPEQVLADDVVAAKVDMLGAMVDGIRIRAIRNPKVNPEALLTQLRSAVRHILEQADGT